MGGQLCSFFFWLETPAILLSSMESVGSVFGVYSARVLIISEQAACRPAERVTALSPKIRFFKITLNYWPKLMTLSAKAAPTRTLKNKNKQKKNPHQFCQLAPLLVAHYQFCWSTAFVTLPWQGGEKKSTFDHHLPRKRSPTWVNKLKLIISHITLQRVICCRILNSQFIISHPSN